MAQTLLDIRLLLKLGPAQAWPHIQLTLAQFLFPASVYLCANLGSSSAAKRTDIGNRPVFREPDTVLAKFFPGCLAGRGVIAESSQVFQITRIAPATLYELLFNQGTNSLSVMPYAIGELESLVLPSPIAP